MAVTAINRNEIQGQILSKPTMFGHCNFIPGVELDPAH